MRRPEITAESLHADRGDTLSGADASGRTTHVGSAVVPGPGDKRLALCRGTQMIPS